MWCVCLCGVWQEWGVCVFVSGVCVSVVCVFVCQQGVCGKRGGVFVLCVVIVECACVCVCCVCCVCVCVCGDCLWGGCVCLMYVCV